MITVERHGDIPWLVIDRPERRNALDDTGWCGLADALRAVEHRPTPVVITGRGACFSAGDDLRHAAGLAEQELLDYAIDTVLAAIRAVVEHPYPVVAAVNGPAVGGGAELVAASDVAVAAASATFRLPEVALGVAPSQFLGLRPCGPKTMAELVLCGSVLTAADALGAGLVGAVVPDADLAAEVDRRTTAIASAPEAAIRAAKRALTRDLRAEGLARIEADIRAQLAIPAPATP
ncbi:enoyl-CoA hydratase/isomerase family protein [Pseudonocardia xishanensis]|uniref:Enoyl-CoA hydratase-related protein n=1 Tax=Pseudonocardia xishanensis TaxID=630995 RepID=A0ABP8RTJ3_9PSEU